LIPIAFIKYLYHFHVDRDYFECHEILEEYWKEETDQQKNSIWVGFILLAVANYHHRRNNFPGATRTLEKAIAIFHCQKDNVANLDINVEQFTDLLQTHLINLKNNNPYQSYSLPILLSNKQLSQCYSQEEISQIDWGKQSDLSDESLINRHKIRDRTDVITERQNALIQRKKTKSD
jgi:uncharacterized protein